MKETPLAKQIFPTLGRVVKEQLFLLICLGATILGMIALAVLLYQTIREGWSRLSIEFLERPPSRIPGRAGIYPAVIGTIWLMALTALFTIPVGVSAAIYLEEFAPQNWFTRFVQTNISNLAGVPSIVYGLLGLAIFVRAFAFGESILSGSLTMSLLLLPLVITASQEAIRAVPPSYREGALALGATQWEAIRTAVLPSAASGIITGIILALSRAIGEAAPLIAIGAATYIRFAPSSPMDSFTVLPVQIYYWAQMPEVGFRHNAAAAILVLMVVLLLFSSTAIYLRYRARLNKT